MKFLTLLIALFTIANIQAHIACDIQPLNPMKSRTIFVGANLTEDNHVDHLVVYSLDADNNLVKNLAIKGLAPLEPDYALTFVMIYYDLYQHPKVLTEEEKIEAQKEMEEGGFVVAEPLGHQLEEWLTRYDIALHPEMEEAMEEIREDGLIPFALFYNNKAIDLMYSI